MEACFGGLFWRLVVEALLTTFNIQGSYPRGGSSKNYPKC